MLWTLPADPTTQPASMLERRLQQLIDEGLGDKDCSLITKYAAPDGKIPGWDPDKA